MERDASQLYILVGRMLTLVTLAFRGETSKEGEIVVLRGPSPVSTGSYHAGFHKEAING